MELKIIAIGNSQGVILPKELLEEMGVQKGDKLSVQRREDGWRMSTYNADFETQMDVARNIMKKRRNLLRALAKA
ncbi:MAG: AbrB/MazE/SpoVT family DNA-binding domain-containing protein [Holosporales bacterium]